MDYKKEQESQENPGSQENEDLKRFPCEVWLIPIVDSCMKDSDH